MSTIEQLTKKDFENQFSTKHDADMALRWGKMQYQAGQEDGYAKGNKEATRRKGKAYKAGLLRAAEIAREDSKQWSEPFNQVHAVIISAIEKEGV